MTQQKLESFKISDKQKPQVKAPRQEADKPAEASYTLGFARIEGILDEAAPGEVAEQLNRILEDLTELETAATTQKDRAGAKKAKAALERTLDLLDYLFRTKAAMAAAVDPSK